MSPRQTRFFFIAASVTLLAAAAIAQGCGNTEDTPTTASTDAGSDGAADAKRDTGPAEDPDSATCDLGHDLTSDIPDAEIADGESSTGICVGCANAHCRKYIEECNKNCQCQGLAGQALECYAKTGDAIGCAGQFASSKITKETQNTAFGLFSCLNSECKDECQTDQFNDAGDAGPKDAGDAG